MKSTPGENSAQSQAAQRTERGADVDVWLLKDSLSKTPWERMQANDDACRFAEHLRTAMKARNAKSK